MAIESVSSNRESCQCQQRNCCCNTGRCPNMPARPAPPTLAGAIRPYSGWIQQSAQANALPYWLVCAQIAQESGFDAKSRSGVGAIGLMQIMPATARDCGIDPETLWDPRQNIHLGCRILADRRDCFYREDPEEKLKFALAAYNGGLGPVINAQALALRRGLNPAQWESLRQVLPEVQVYLNGEWIQPDYRQIIDYVNRIWKRFTLWNTFEVIAEAPVPSGEQQH